MLCLILKFKNRVDVHLQTSHIGQMKLTCPEHDGAPVAIPSPAWSLLRHLFSVSHIQVATTWSPVVILQMVHNTITGNTINIVGYTSICVLRRKEFFMPSLYEMGSLVLDEKFLYISSMYFSYFIIISPWLRAQPFIWANLNSLYPRIFDYLYL